MVTVHGPAGPGMDMRMNVDVRRGPGRGMGMGMHRGGGHEMGLGWAINNPKIREQLGITPDQVTKIRQETLSFQKAEILSRADLQVKRLELHSLLEAETPDRVAIDKSLHAANAAQFTVEKAAIDHQLAMRALITPEQRQKLEKMREEFRRPGAGFGGPGGARGMMRQGGNVMYMRPDGGDRVRSGENAWRMRRGAGDTAHPAPQSAQPVPSQPQAPPQQ